MTDAIKDTAAPLDFSDLDRHMGVPIQPARMVEPVAANDIRRWVQAMHYPNRLHYDAEFAQESRHAQLVAPQSFTVAMDDAHGSAAPAVGAIPESHLLFGGDEWWFFGPRIRPGDRIVNERIPLDYVIKETRFAGPTCFQRGDNNYYNQDGELVARQRSTAIRYRASASRATVSQPEADPEWTDAQLADLAKRKFAWIEMLHALGHKERFWDDVEIGDTLPERVIGPHSLITFATEWRAYPFTIWGGTHRRTDLDIAALGFTEEMSGHENDPVMERINPELTDGAYFGPSRGHLQPRWARHIGMPRGYGYGASMGAWAIDYFAGWAGEHGMVRYCNLHYRAAALTGDITVLVAEVTDKRIDADGSGILACDLTMKTQDSLTICTAKVEVALPTRG